MDINWQVIAVIVVAVAKGAQLALGLLVGRWPQLTVYKTILDDILPNVSLPQTRLLVAKVVGKPVQP